MMIYHLMRECGEIITIFALDHELAELVAACEDAIALFDETGRIVWYSESAMRDSL